MLWKGHKPEEEVLQVHPSVREVPIPEASVLLEGNKTEAVQAWLERLMQATVRLAASISLNIHHEAKIANRRGEHGPFSEIGSIVSSNSSSLANGNSEDCFEGPLPRAAALAMRLKWMSNDCGMLPCLKISSCLAALR